MSGMLGAVMMGLTGPFVGVIARKTLHASAFELGLLTTASVAGNVLSLQWANMMEGRPKMPYALWAWVIARSLFIACLFTTTSLSFVLVISLINFIVSIATPAYSALMKEIYPDGDRGTIMGYARVCTIGVYVLVTMVAAPLVAGTNYRLAFPVAGVFGVVSAFVFGRIKSSEVSGDATVSPWQFFVDGLLILRDDRGFRWFCTGIFVYGFANFMITPLQTIWQVKIGVDERWAAIYSVVSSALMMVSYFYWGKIVDRKRPEWVISVQTFAWAFVPVLYCIASEPWMLLPAAVVGGIIGAGLELSYFNGVLHFAPADRVTQYQGLFFLLIGIRGIVAPMVGAALQQSRILTTQQVFLVSAIMILGSVLIQMAGMRRYQSQFAGDDNT